MSRNTGDGRPEQLLVQVRTYQIRHLGCTLQSLQMFYNTDLPTITSLCLWNGQYGSKHWIIPTFRRHLTVRLSSAHANTSGRLVQHEPVELSRQVSSSARTQAPTEAPPAPSPVRPGAQLRHWLGPPSPRRSPPNGRSTRPSARLTVLSPVGRPPGQQGHETITENTSITDLIQVFSNECTGNLCKGCEGPMMKWFLLGSVSLNSP